MVQCPRCGAECSEQDVKAGRCFRCATFIPDSEPSSASRTVTFNQLEAHSEGDASESPGAPVMADSDPGKKNLIRPRNLSPEYERHVADEWHATILKVGAVDDTIKKGASPAEDSYDLNIGVRRVAEDPSDNNADYVLLEELGKGAMGKVWSARHASLDRTVAIKIPHADVSKEKATDSSKGTEARNQFVSEVVVTGRLDHPNIVPIHDIAHTQDGQLFCSMKKVEGRPWNECIDLPEFTREKNLEILMKVCDAIRYSHDKHGIIHRDLKPHNIVVGDFGEVAVMDFGLALEIDNLEGKHLGLAGTPAYMAPEMATGNSAELGFHTDVYLIGAILYEIITGSPPHPSPAPTESKSKWKQNVQHIVSRNEIVSTEEKGELVDIAYQALATNISDRFQTVQEFQDALRAFREHQKSVTLSKRGFEHLKIALKNGRKTNGSISRFDDFDRARFAFDEALQLWSKNREAKKGAEKTRIEFAKYALDQQAYAQGIALLDEHNPEHAALLNDLQKAKRRQENALKAKKRLWQSVFALAGVLVIGATIAAIMINNQREIALENEQKAIINANEAVKAKKAANKSESDALHEGFLANLAKATAVQASNVADSQKQLAEAAEQTAKDARDSAEKNKIKAESSAYEAEIGLAAAEAKRNAFDNLRESLARISTLVESAERNSVNNPPAANLVAESQTEAEGIIKEALDNYTKDLNKIKNDLDSGVADQLQITAEQEADQAILALSNRLDTSERVAGGQDLPASLAKSDPRGWEWGYLRFLSKNRLGVTDLVKESPSADEYECVALTPDLGCVVAGTSDGKLYVWEKKESGSGNDFRQIENDLKKVGHDRILSVAIKKSNNDDCLLAMASKKGVSLLDLLQADSGNVTIKVLDDSGTTGQARSVAFSADGKLLAASWQDGHVAVWSIDDAQECTFLWGIKRHDTGVGSVKFNSDSSRIVTASDGGQVGVWNATDGKPIAKFSNGSTAVYTADFLSRSQNVIAGDREGKIMVWQVPKGASAEKYDKSRNAAVRNETAISQSLVKWNGHSAAVRSLAVSKTQTGEIKVFSAGHDNTLKVWELSPDFEQETFVKNLRGHGGWVRSCAISADGSSLLSGGFDGRVRLWDWEKNRIAQILKPAPKNRASSRQQFTSVSYSQNGNWIATTSVDGLLTFWDMAASGGPEPQFPTEGHDMLATSVAPFSNGEFMLTSAGDNTTRVWEVSTGREVARLGGQWQQSDGTGTGYRGIAAVSADGNFIASGSDPLPNEKNQILAKIWNWRAQNARRPIVMMMTPENAVKKGEKPEATALAFSPDGHSLVVGDQFGACRLYSVSDGRWISTFKHRGKVTAAKFLGSDRLLTSSSDGTVVQWKIEGDTVTEALKLQHGGRRIAAMDVSSDGRYVVTASVAQNKSEDKKYFTKFHYWDLRNPQEARSQADKTYLGNSTGVNSENMGIPGIASHLEFRPGRESVVMVTMFKPDSSERYSVGEWDISKNDYTIRGKPKASEIAMATYLPKRGSSSFITIGGRGARHFVDRKTKMTFRAQGSMTSGSFSPDSKNYVCASTDGTVKFWRLDSTTNDWISDPTPKLLSLHRPEGSSRGLKSITFHPERSDLLLSAGEDGKAVVWQKNEQEWEQRMLLGEHKGPLSCAIFSPDGKDILTGGSDGIVRIWNFNLETGQVDLVRPLLHEAPVEAIAVSRSNEQIVVAVGSDAFLWDFTHDAEKPTKLRGHAAEVTAVTFCGDKNRIGTASKDQTIRIWDTSDLSSEPKPLLTLEGHTGHVTSLVFIPENIDYDENQNDGAYLLSGSPDGQVILWPSLPKE